MFLVKHILDQTEVTESRLCERLAKPATMEQTGRGVGLSRQPGLRSDQEETDTEAVDEGIGHPRRFAGRPCIFDFALWGSRTGNGSISAHPAFLILSKAKARKREPMTNLWNPDASSTPGMATSHCTA